MSETILVRAVLQALALRRIWSWRNNSGLTVLGAAKSRRVIKGAPAGSPDVLLILPGGRLAGIECKTKTGTMLPSQVAWAEKAKRHGVRYGVVRSVSGALALLDRWLVEVGADIDREIAAVGRKGTVVRIEGRA